jgi:type III secretion protein R
VSEDVRQAQRAVSEANGEPASGLAPPLTGQQAQRAVSEANGEPAGGLAPPLTGPIGKRKPRRFLTAALVLCGALTAGGITMSMMPEEASAQTTARQAPKRKLRTSDLTLKGSVASRPLVLVGLLAALSLLPFVIIMVTSFVKISVVLSIVRSALGTQQIPPTQVITGLAIILTVYIMAPVGLEIYKTTEDLINQKRPGESLMSAETVDLVMEALEESVPPIKGFLSKNSHLKDRAMFYSLAKRLRKAEDRAGIGPEDFMVLVPAFVISELKESFQIGFIIFVPFLVIDLVVSNILMALGMQMLSPTTISLPFKLLLFVVIDGWYLITKGLIIGYL